MSEPKLISPLLDEYIMGDPISDHHGVRCCPAIKNETEEKYIVKILSIPASSVQLDALLLTGAYPTAEAALAYFKELADSAVAEAELLQRLSKLEGFVGFEGWQIEPMEDGTGFDVYLVGAYRTTLERSLTKNPLTHLKAVNLGLDMCAALSVARQSGFLYVDLKPENIVITGDGEYRVGDLGFIALDSLKYASLPEKYRSAYTAPEITDAYSALNETIDIYAAGLILYQVYNNGVIPVAPEGESLAAPEFADSQMAEIILKACAKNPEDRWQTPLEMGQAIIGYMLQNDICDTPIIPLPEVEEPEEEEIAEAASEAEEPAKAPEIPLEELSEEDQLALVIEEAAAPTEEIPEELEDAPVTEEVGEMLAQADELIAHETPDPVVQPDPIDVPIPPMIQPEEEPQEEETEEAPAEEPQEEETEAEEVTEAKPEESAEEAEEADVEVVPVPAEAEEVVEKPKKSHKRLFAAIAGLLIALMVAACGYLFYEYFYTQTISGITVSGSEDHVTVLLDTNIDNKLLTIVCSNTYGSSIRASVENNKAEITGLIPDTQYRITVEISGLHRLVGTTSVTYGTDPRSEIVSFTAITGNTDGSVILNFTVQGYDDTGWKIFYSANGEGEKSVSFTGHTVTINGLTVGKDYTFRLEPVSTDYIIGEHTIVHKASKLILAEDVKVLGFQEGGLNLAWKAPEGVTVSEWTVRCYNETGFDTTLTVTDTSVTIPGLDPAGKYTVDICAKGMTQSTQAFVTSNSITFTDVVVDSSVADQLTVTWEYEGNEPEGGWLVLYSINGSEALVIHAETASCVIPSLIPNSKYDITIKPATGATTFGGTASYTVPDYGTFSGYRVTNANMTFWMCNTPNKANWNKNDVAWADRTNTFAVGKKASFIVLLNVVYSTSSDPITTRMVIRDSNGNPVIISDSTRTWTQMWGVDGYCYYDIPTMPQTVGSYTVDIYFNNAFVTTQAFTIQ